MFETLLDCIGNFVSALRSLALLPRSNTEGSFAFIVPEDPADDKPNRKVTRPRNDDPNTAMPGLAGANGNGGYIQLKHLEKIRLRPHSA